MLVHVCRTGQFEIRNMSIQKWGLDNRTGRRLLYKLVQLYTALVWESTLLLALCTDDIIPEGCDFGKEDMDRLPNDKTAPAAAASDAAGGGSNGAAAGGVGAGTMHCSSGNADMAGGVGSLLADSDMREWGDCR